MSDPKPLKPSIKLNNYVYRVKQTDTCFPTSNVDVKIVNKEELEDILSALHDRLAALEKKTCWSCKGEVRADMMCNICGNGKPSPAKSCSHDMGYLWQYVETENLGDKVTTHTCSKMAGVAKVLCPYCPKPDAVRECEHSKGNCWSKISDDTTRYYVVSKSDYSTCPFCDCGFQPAVVKEKEGLGNPRWQGIKEKAEKRLELSEELRSLLNRHSRENCSNTPDFILAEYMLNCLIAGEVLVQKRNEFYGTDDGKTIKEHLL